MVHVKTRKGASSEAPRFEQHISRKLLYISTPTPNQQTSIRSLVQICQFGALTVRALVFASARKSRSSAAPHINLTSSPQI